MMSISINAVQPWLTSYCVYRMECFAVVAPQSILRHYVRLQLYLVQMEYLLKSIQTLTVPL